MNLLKINLNLKRVDIDIIHKTKTISVRGLKIPFFKRLFVAIFWQENLILTFDNMYYKEHDEGKKCK